VVGRVLEWRRTGSVTAGVEPEGGCDATTRGSVRVRHGFAYLEWEKIDGRDLSARLLSCSFSFFFRITRYRERRLALKAQTPFNPEKTSPTTESINAVKS
jgi:hypothetical protein